jgi:hypothetical protein
MLLQSNNKLKKDKFHLSNPEFTSLQESTISLTDEIIVYHNGQTNVIITKKTLNRYPIIHSKYYYDQDNMTEDITISLCPYSQTSIVYYGIYRMSGDIYNNNIILENQETKNKIHQLSGISLSTTMHKESVSAFNKMPELKQRAYSTSITESNESLGNLLKCPLISNNTLEMATQRNYIKKMSTKQMIVRNAISTFIDCKYLDYDGTTNNKAFNLPDKYDLINQLAFQQGIQAFKYFTKMLVYGIEYVSRKTAIDDLETNNNGSCTQLKHTLIISKNAKKYITKHPESKENHDYIKNGYKEYFIKSAEQLKTKGAIIIPCYYFVWLTFYPNSKVILLE